ncbi:MAG: hypothetical protein QGG42_12135 [Phycisphaerae bacterium]|nr:hypothetical protein [Phycisphaerae bacterium]
MLEDETQLREAVDRIVADILAADIAQKKVYTDERVGKEYWNLITPGAFDKELIVIAVLGYPEQAGVWSYTLLRSSRISETSMESYFREFADNDIGLVAVNPNCFDPDIEGETFHYQLQRVVDDIGADKKLGFIGFSMGGKIMVEFLEQQPELLGRVAGLALIDPTLPNRLKTENIRTLLDNDTLLIASEGEVNSPGAISSFLLKIPKVSFPGIHGQMPSKSLDEVIKFYKDRT